MRARIPLKFVTRNVDRHGNVRWYFRRADKYVRLPGLPGSTEFMEAYKLALEGNRHAGAKSFEALCKQYMASAEFAAFEEYTRRRKRTVLDEICELRVTSGRRIGSAPYKGLTRGSVLWLRDDKAKSSQSMADFRVKQISALYAWALKRGLVPINPAADVGKLHKDEGFYSWSEQDVEAFEARYSVGTRERLAMAVMLYFGVRRSDAVKLGPNQESKDGTSITFQQQKGRKRAPQSLTLPILPPLRAILDATSVGETYLLSGYGKPWANGDSFGNWFRGVCREAELPEASPHGLRKIAATRCAEAGATAHELMAMFGWRTMGQALVYTRAAEQKKLAASAAAKLSK